MTGFDAAVGLTTANNSMQRTALLAAVDAERSTDNSG